MIVALSSEKLRAESSSTMTDSLAESIVWWWVVTRTVNSQNTMALPVILMLAGNQFGVGGHRYASQVKEPRGQRIVPSQWTV